MKYDFPCCSYFTLSILLFIVSVFSTKTTAQDLSDSIYHDLDQLVAEYPTLTAINSYQLRIKERYSDLKSDQERLALVIMHCNMGYYLKEYGKHYDALDHYRNAWSIYSSYDLANYDIIEYCLKPLGNLLTITGNFADAENIITHYMQMAQMQGNHVAYTSGIINLSVVYHNVGNYNEALELLKNHIEKDNIGEAQKRLIENNMTTNLLALKKYNGAQIKIQNQEARTISGLKAKAQLFISRKQFDAAREALEEIELLLMEKKDARQLAKFYVEKSQFHFLVKEKDSALLRLEDARNILLPTVGMQDIFINKSILYAENTLIDIFDAYADYTEDWERKLDFYELSFYVENLIFNSITDPQSKLIFQTSYRSRGEKCVQLLYKEYQESQDDSLIWIALNYAEISKARVLKASSHQKSLLEQNPNDSLLQLNQDLIQDQQSLVGELIRNQLSSTDEKIKARLNQKFIELSSRISKTRNKIDEIYPLNTFEGEVNFKVLQKQLRSENAQILYTFFGDRSLYLFWITDNGIRWHKHSVTRSFKEELVTFIHLFESSKLINDDIVNFVNTSFRFSELLRRDIKEEYENLVIIPDGLLSFLPFEALITKKINHSNFSKMPFWLKEWTIAYNTSLAFYQQNEKEMVLKTLYGVFPIFINSSRYLKSSEREAEMISARFEGKIDRYENATKGNFLRNSDQFDVLHLSTHAAGGSFTVPAYIEFIDDILLLPEIYELNLEANLVVLSACETGVGKIIKGATPMSLARGFHSAGVKNILLTKWKVNDYATSQIMEGFYKELQESNSPSISIKKARVSYLMDPDVSNIEKSPYYWAGFNYYGKIEEGSSSMDRKYTLVVGITIFLLLLSLYIFMRFYRKN
jgi:CHAT domain-containing protein